MLLNKKIKWVDGSINTTHFMYYRELSYLTTLITVLLTPHLKSVDHNIPKVPFLTTKNKNRLSLILAKILRLVNSGNLREFSSVTLPLFQAGNSLLLHCSSAILSRPDL